MNKILFALLILAIGFVSCNKDPQPLSKQEIKYKVDSISSIRMKEADQQAQVDLDHRMKIEVKVKVDSIVNALQAQKLKADSTLQAKSLAQPKAPAPAQPPTVK